jgi:hypothetical protein
MTEGTIVEIEVYGIWDEAPAATSCGCGAGGCGPGAGPAPTMGEMFQSLRTSIEGSDLNKQCTLRFIDVIKESDTAVDQVRKLIETGYSLPLTALNGKWSFHGGISNELFSLRIREMLDGMKGQDRPAH